jgi:hypothetical protein
MQWPLLLIKSGMPADISLQSCLVYTEWQFRHLICRLLCNGTGSGQSDRMNLIRPVVPLLNEMVQEFQSQGLSPVPTPWPNKLATLYMFRGCSRRMHWEGVSLSLVAAIRVCPGLSTVPPLSATRWAGLRPRRRGGGLEATATATIERGRSTGSGCLWGGSRQEHVAVARADGLPPASCLRDAGQGKAVEREPHSSLTP